MIIIEETGHLVSCAYDGKINIWDYPQAKLVHTFEKNELIRCLTYVFDEKDVEEEVDGITTKKTVDDIKLFVGTDQGNLHCF